MNVILNYLSADGTNPVILFAILLLFLSCGDIVTQKTKALIPSLLVFVLLLGVASWIGLIPPDIVTRVGISGPMFSIANVIIVVNMGTTMNIKDITSNWRIATLGLVALVGVAVGCCTIGTMIFGWDQAVISAPVVGGGIVAALEMQGAAKALGKENLATMAILILTLQSLPAYLIIPPLFKKLMRKDLDEHSVEEIKAAISVKKEEEAEVTTIIPEKYWTANTILLGLAIVGCLAVVSNKICVKFMGNYAISTSIFSLIYGIIFTQLRLLPKSATNKAVSSGWIFILVIVGALASIATSSPTEILKLLAPIAGMIFCGIAGIFVITSLVGKFAFKYDWRLSFIMGLNCLLGFPLNYMLVLESIEFSAKNEMEKEYLNNKYVPMMLVAGFVTVTIGSVLLAGVMKGFL
ncbi:MAG: hypothetical protein LBR30_07680 [Clostridioides sp.]|jgi:hypothetical protein|nr:hypothetical protein [Clostridioides sp.]